MNLIELEKAFIAAKSITELNKILTSYLYKFHITTFSFTYYYHQPQSHHPLKYDYASKDFIAWHKHYLTAGYEDIDSTLKFAHKNILPVFWNLQRQLAEAKTPREKELRKDSIAFGIVQGLSIPIHTAEEDFATLALIEMRGQKCLENWRSIQYELFSAAHYYFFYLQQQLLPTTEENKKFHLNQRELQCLTLIAKHYSVNAMAKVLGITPRTVNFHIQRLNKKLGTANKYQSLIKALQKGVLRL